MNWNCPVSTEITPDLAHARRPSIEQRRKDGNLEDDGQFLRLMMAGEERGFVALYRKYQAQVYRFSLQIGGVRHIAEEVTQETFLALMKAPHKYNGERGPLLLYLFGIEHTKLTYRFQGRDFRLTDISGNVVKAILS